MKTVTRKNLLKLVKMKKDYEKTKNKKILNEINSYIENVINKDKKYYAKLTKYNFCNDILQYLL